MYRIGLIALLFAGAVKAAVFIVAVPESIQQPESGGGETEYVIADFEEGYVRDDTDCEDNVCAWIANETEGTTITTVGRKDNCKILPCSPGGGGPGRTDCTYSIAAGQGIGGSDALLMTADDEGNDTDTPGDRVCSLWVFRKKVNNNDPNSASLGNPKDCTGYFVGCDYVDLAGSVFELELNVKFPSGWRDTYDAQLRDGTDARYPFHQNLHIGTYQFDPGQLGGPDTKESDNQHFYHQTWVNTDEAAGGWIKLRFNALPTHQRGNDDTQMWNASVGNYGYWQTLTRFYVEWCVPGGDAPYNQRCSTTAIEAAFPHGTLVDDIKLVEVAQDPPVTVDIIGVATGSHQTGGSVSTTVQFDNNTGGEVCGWIIPGRWSGGANTTEITESAADRTGYQCLPDGVTEYDFDAATTQSTRRFVGAMFVPESVTNGQPTDAAHFNLSGVAGGGSGHDERRWHDATTCNATAGPGGTSGCDWEYGPNDAPDIHSDWFLFSD